MNPPQPTNVQRAQWAKNALTVFTAETYSGDHPEMMHLDDLESAIGDLICDLLHLARYHPRMDAAAIHAHARETFETELADEERCQPRISHKRRQPRKNATHSPEPWDAEGITILYATPDQGDAMTMIEVRANVAESGWDTVAFVEAVWPNARTHARLIAASPTLLSALLNIKRLAGKSGDREADPLALLELIASEAHAALNKATQPKE